MCSWHMASPESSKFETSQPATLRFFLKNVHRIPKTSPTVNRACLIAKKNGTHRVDSEQGSPGNVDSQAQLPHVYSKASNVTTTSNKGVHIERFTHQTKS